MTYINDFIDGQSDCRKGNVDRTNPTDAYLDGYAAEKFKEESDTARDIKRESVK